MSPGGDRRRAFLDPEGRILPGMQKNGLSAHGRKVVMALGKKEDYERKAERLLLPIVEKAGFELVDLEYVKEGGTWYLRGFIDKPGGITIDDCEAVSRVFNDALEEEDFIPDSYVMEICSPGLDRPLKKPKDFERSLGKVVEIRTYRPVDGSKEFEGILDDWDDEQVTILMDTGTQEDSSEEEDTDIPEEKRTFARKDIALIRLAVIF